MKQYILIKIHEQEILFTFAEILLLSNEYRSQILNSSINNVQTITFQFCLSQVYDKQIKSGDWYGSMWKHKSDGEYPVHSNHIECKNCDLKRQELGVLYQNAIKWFQNIQKQYGNDKLNQQSFYLHLMLNKI